MPEDQRNEAFVHMLTTNYVGKGPAANARGQFRQAVMATAEQPRNTRPLVAIKYKYKKPWFAGKNAQCSYIYERQRAILGVTNVYLNEVLRSFRKRSWTIGGEAVKALAAEEKLRFLGQAMFFLVADNPFISFDNADRQAANQVLGGDNTFRFNQLKSNINAEEIAAANAKLDALKMTIRTKIREMKAIVGTKVAAAMKRQGQFLFKSTGKMELTSAALEVAEFDLQFTSELENMLAFSSRQYDLNARYCPGPKAQKKKTGWFNKQSSSGGGGSLLSSTSTLNSGSQGENPGWWAGARARMAGWLPGSKKSSSSSQPFSDV